MKSKFVLLVLGKLLQHNNRQIITDACWALSYLTGLITNAFLSHGHFLKNDLCKTVKIIVSVFISCWIVRF